MTQVLHGHHDKVTCVEWCKAYGKLVACSRGRIVIYVPERDRSIMARSAEEQFKLVEECQGKISTRWRIEQIIDMKQQNQLLWNHNYLQRNFGGENGNLNGDNGGDSGDDGGGGGGEHDMIFECACWNLYGDRLLLSGGNRLMLYELVLPNNNTTAENANSPTNEKQQQQQLLNKSKSRSDLDSTMSNASTQQDLQSSSSSTITPTMTPPMTPVNDQSSSGSSSRVVSPKSSSSVSTPPMTPKATLTSATLSDFNNFRSGGGAKFQLVWQYVNPTPVRFPLFCVGCFWAILVHFLY